MVSLSDNVLLLCGLWSAFANVLVKWFLCQNNVLLLCGLWSAFANLLVKCSDYNFVLTVRLTTRDVSVEFTCD